MPVRTRIGLVGLGDIGMTQHLPALVRSNRIVLDSVADLSETRRAQAQAVLAGTEVAVFSDAHAMLARPLDAVVLATPPWATPTLARTALEQGLFVLAEKPVAVKIEEAYALQSLPKEWLARYQLGLTYRHDTAIARLRDAVALGVLGEGPLLVHARIYDEALNPEDGEHYARTISALAHGNPSMHEGAHVFDWLAVILGSGPEEVVDAWSLTTIVNAPGPNVVGARLRYPEDVVVNVEFGWLLDVSPPGFIRVTGSRGTAELGLHNFDLTICTATTTETFDHHLPKMRRSFDLQLELFIDLAQGVITSPSVGVDAGVSTLEIANQIESLL